MDGENEGVYLGNCGGAATGFKNLIKACKSENFLGTFLVKCKLGEEKNRMQCESADSDANKTVLFKGWCGSGDTVDGTNLLKACKRNIGETLVKCKRKNNVWKEKKLRHCRGKKDRFKMRNCSSSEQATLISDYEFAEDRVATLRSELETEFDENDEMDNNLRNKMKKVLKKLEKFQAAMYNPRTFVCKANKNSCSTSRAHTLPVGHKVKICDNYFFDTSQDRRASTLVHEISHYKSQTTDKGDDYGGCVSPTLPTADKNFHLHAEYYEHIVECGLYIPN